MLESGYSSLISNLKKILPYTSWQWVFPALRLDPLIWDSLCNFKQVFGVNDLSELIHHPDDCTPAALAIKALKYPRTPQELRTLPLIPIELAFREQVEAAESASINSLKEAALLALNLRQKRQSTGSWNDWAFMLENIPTTALSCLFGMIPDQVEYLQALLPSQVEEIESEEAYRRLIKIILCNPAPFSVQLELITLILQSLSIPEQELFYNTLSAVQPALAKRLNGLSGQLHPSSQDDQKLPTNAQEVLHKLKSFAKQLPLSLKIFDQREPNLKTQQLTQSIQFTAQTQALMLAKLAILSEINTSESEAFSYWENAVRLQPQSESLKALSILSYVSKQQVVPISDKEEVNPHLEPSTALLQFADRLLDEKQDVLILSPTTDLKNLAPKIFEEIETTATLDPFLSDQEIQSYLLVLLTHQFITYRFYALAQQTISRLLNQKPNHSALLALSAILLHVQGIHDQALNLFHLLEALHPQDLRLTSLLAQSHEANWEWQSAFQLWKNFSTKSSQSIYEIITCARLSGQESIAIEQCTSALKALPQDGILLSLLAEVDHNQAFSRRLELHQQATELAPAEPYVWLSYARTARENQENEKALSILKAAEQTLPKSPFIQCALGELYLAAGQPSLALPHLQSATTSIIEYQPISFNFLPHQLLSEDEYLPEFIETFKLRFNPDWGSTAITFDQWCGNLIARLSEALLQLGHRKEARQILEDTFEKYPYHAGLAHQLAHLKMMEGKYQEAGQLLKEIVLGKMTNSQAKVDFARCALHVPDLASSDEVILTLQTVLEDQPDHFEALTLLAQVLARINQPQAALKVYDQILRLPQAHEPPIKEQLAHEMSKAALKAGEYELALTTLLECDQQNPAIQHDLAETYLHLGLHLEAAQTAQNVRSLNPSDVETLIWYANLMLRLAQSAPACMSEFHASAIEALQQSVELAPQRSDLKLALAETYFEAGEHWQAREMLLRFVPENGSEMSASDTELIKAAQYLYLLGEQNAALACYEKSVTLLQATSPSDPEKISEILQNIADIYRQIHRYLELERTLKHAIDLCPNKLSLFFDYIAAWTEVNHYPSQSLQEDHTVLNILNLFEHHLEQNPEEKPLILLYGLFLRWTGNSAKAIDILSQLFADLTNSDRAPNTTMHFRLLIATLTELSRIHRSRGEQHLADYWLEKGIQKLQLGSGIVKNEILELYSDWIETAISRGEDCQSHLFDVYNKNPDRLRLVALMSYTKALKEDFHGAKILFETALPAIAEHETSPATFHPAIVKFLDSSRRLETQITFAKVAQRLGQWNLACELLNQAIRLEPEGIRAHRERLRSVVLRAEYQHLCQRLGIVTNAAGDTALSDEAKRDFEISAQFLQQNAAHPAGESVEEIYPLEEWIRRGKLAFAVAEVADLESASGQLSPEILSVSLLTASQASLQKLITLATPYQDDPWIKFQMAVAMSSLQPQWAASLLENLLKNLENNPYPFCKNRGWLLSRKHFIALIGAAYAQAILNSLDSNIEWVTTKRSAALQALDAALEYYPDEPNWHLLAAHLTSLDRSSQESIQKTISHLEKAIQSKGHSLDIHLELAQLYLANQKIDSAIRTLENALHHDENHPQIDYWLAQSYLKQRQFEIAAQYAQSAIEKNPFEIDYILLRGEIALQMQDAATALQIAEQALEQPIEDPRIWGLFARALHAAGKTDDALRVFEQTIPEKIEYIDLHLEHIEIIRQRRGAQAALQEINTLLGAFPDAIPLLLCQAEILAEIEETEPAIIVAQTALRQSHQSPSTARLEDHAHSHRLLGDLFYRNGHLDQAIYHLSEAIRLVPNEEAAYLTLGDVYLSRGENERALVAYQQCLKINAENSLAYFKSGVLYKELKDYFNAEQMLRQAARLEPNNLAVQRQLGAVVALNLIHTRRTKGKNYP